MNSELKMAIERRDDTDAAIRVLKRIGGARSRSSPGLKG